MIKKIIEPRVLSIITTEKCTANCHNCCFRCGPELSQRLSLKEMKFLVDEVIRDFPTIIACVFTGGECTTLGMDLLRIIRYASVRNLRCRIVSNGHWAVSELRALLFLEKLKNVGLHELNLSTGDEHQKYIPYDRIVYACQAAIKLGLFVAVNIESTPKSKFTSLTMKNDNRISNEIMTGKIVIQDSLWIEFNNKTIDSDKTRILNDGPCTNLFNTISVSPNGHLQACCGLTCKNNLYLDLGSFQRYSLKRLYEEQFDDLIKVWLYTHGPKKIYSFLCEKKGIPNESYQYPHICSLCHHVLENTKNMDIIKDNISYIIPSVMLKYQFINNINNISL